MLLNLDYIYGYYEEESFVWLAEHYESATNTSIGVYKCIKTSTKINPFMVNFASQVPSPYIDCPYNGRFGNIVIIGDYLYIPYYNRSISDSWDTLVKYSKSDITMLRAKHIQVKGIVQEGFFKDQNKFSSITYQGLWNPILTTIDDYLYYLIDDVIFILEPNYLSIIGEITFQDGFKALGITSLVQGGESWIAVMNEIEIRYVRANQIKHNITTEYYSTITEIGLSPNSISVISKNQNIEFAKTYIYEGILSGSGIILIKDSFTDIDGTRLDNHVSDIGGIWYAGGGSIYNNKARDCNINHTKIANSYSCYAQAIITKEIVSNPPDTYSFGLVINADYLGNNSDFLRKYSYDDLHLYLNGIQLSASFISGSLYRIERRNDIVYAYCNGELIGSQSAIGVYHNFRVNSEQFNFEGKYIYIDSYEAGEIV